MTKANDSTPKRTPVEEIGKVRLIDRLLTTAGTSLSDTVSFGEESGNHWISSQKLLLEGIDFDLIYTPLKHLGYKAVLGVLGPIAAHNYTPCTLSLNIGLSKRFCVEDIEELWSGVSAALQENKITNISLDLSSSLTGLTISLSSQGKQKTEVFVQTPKPQPGELLCITGNVGAAFMGLQLLEREKVLFNNNPEVQPQLDGHKFILQSYLSPQLNTSIRESFSDNNILPSDGVFITNGLADAVKFICKKNNLGAKVFLDKIPIASQTFEMAEELHMDAITAALNGGDDFQILYSVPLSQYETIKRELPNLDVIGHLTSDSGYACLVTPDGAEIELKAQGWSERTTD
ncbi:MAG: AIR synthase related protein [Rikenellaceae bacterium]|nr:AIR synthase related protein [Rikenellaceae bacterium]